MANNVEYYRKLMGTENFNDEKERVYSENKDLYNKEVQSFLDKETVDIDNFTEKYENITVLIKKHSNPLNSDKEDRKIYIPVDIPFYRGSIITWYNNFWIIINDINEEDKNGMSIKGNMQKCNNTLKWIDSKGITQQIPCIIQNQTLYSDGLNENNTVTMLDTKKSLVVSSNNLTKELCEGQRLLFDRNKRYCYQISQIDGLTAQGLLYITLTSTTYNSSTDDLNNNLCDINKLAVYEIRILSTNPSSVNVGKSMGLQIELKKNGVIVTDSSILSQITYTSDNVNVATIDNIGLVTGISEGNCNIIVKYGDSVQASIGVNVINTVTPDVITYDLTPVASMGLVIKKGNTNCFTGYKYINGVEVPNALFDFNVDYNGLSTSSISMVETTDNYIKVKNVSVETSTPYKTIFIRYKEKGQTNWINKEVIVKGLFG